jgi:hypothetical protein
LLWTVRAAQAPSLRRYLAAGAGVGLATAAKFIGVGSALPIMVWGALAGIRDRRQWLWLALAGIASLAAFFALNPFVGAVVHYGLAAIDFYEGRARWEGSDRGVVRQRVVEFLAWQHGWVLGAFLLLGVGWAVWRLRPRGAGADRMAALLPLSLALGYPAVYAAALTRFRTHNLLPALGGTALVCAIGLLLAARWVLRRSRRRAVTLLVWALPAALLLARPANYATSQGLTDTWAEAGRLLRHRLAPMQSRQVAFEPKGARLALADGQRYVTKVPLPALSALSHDRLDLMDAEVFPAARSESEEPGAAFYRARRERVAEVCALEVRPRLFRRSGAPLTVLLHPWSPTGPPQSIPFSSQGPDGLTAALPDDLAAGAVVSITIAAPSGSRHGAVRLLPGGESIPLDVIGRRRRRLWLVTSRFVAPAAARALALPSAAGADPPAYELRLSRWTKARCN